MPAAFDLEQLKFCHADDGGDDDNDNNNDDDNGNNGITNISSNNS